MRKHRLFGVVIAVLLGAGLLALLPVTPHHAVGNRADTLLARDASAIRTIHDYEETVRAEGLTVPTVPGAESGAVRDPLIALSAYVRQLPPVPAVQPAHDAAPRAATPDAEVWAELRQCESGGDYAEDTGNGYYGAYQFALATWESLGLGGLPSAAAPSVQDAAASTLQARRGWSQWPVCSRRLGL